MKKQAICKVILYRGRRVKVIERATGFMDDPLSRYWVRALEPVCRYRPGEEFTVSRKHVHRQLTEEK
jgi:hypothetical protein